ncbi:MAG TPA: hypothetical protein VLG38_03745 [Gammaproteobacteria bacterium]|nr:hypothetical protein [Gammaproteobacteria bacterium]
MSPYKLIRGSDKNIAAFEAEIAKALEEGFDLANDLVVQLKSNANGETETILYQSMICDDALELDEDDDEDYEDEEVDEFEEEEYA